MSDTTENNTEDTTVNEIGQDTETETPNEQQGKAGREAARYRRQLRDVEAERDQLLEQVKTLRTVEVERLVSAAHLKPAALWAAGSTLDDLVDDEGKPDPDKISAAVARAKESLGIPDRLRAASPGSGGNRGDDIEAEDASREWKQAFTPRRGR